jgi:alpha-L-fucosidase 2
MAIYPLGFLNVEGSDRDKQIIRESLLQIDQLGTGYWCGYSFTWMACLAARIGESGRVLSMLDLYLRGFISRNGFHLNGDYKNLGLSRFKYRPFTLEGNFAAAQAVHEMLLQSWGGTIRIFPTVVEDWQDVAFSGLRAEGAFLVSAQRENGCTVRVRIETERDNLLKLKNPFGRCPVRWSGKEPEKLGNDCYRCRLNAGEYLEGEVLNSSA